MNLNIYDAIIVGGSFAGLSAALSLGRSLRQVLVIDSGKPCNQKVLHSHNLLTHDGEPPSQIIEKALQDLKRYSSVDIIQDEVIDCKEDNNQYIIQLKIGNEYYGKKILFSTGVKDIFPDIEGFSDCWGISILHCPYCHGYEIRDEKLGVFANGDIGFEFARLISNWSKDVTLFTGAKSTLTIDQIQRLKQNNINIIEKKIVSIQHSNGNIDKLILEDNTSLILDGLFAKIPFEQHCKIPEKLGCTVNELGYINIDIFNRTSLKNVYAAGDNTSMLRSLANAVAEGNKAGAMMNMDLVVESF